MSSSRRRFAAGMAFTVAAVVVGVPSAPAGAAPPEPDTPGASAARNMASLVASRPAFLRASTNEAFVAGKPATVGASQYVPYERTYAGLPEVGGDFVLATDAAGQLTYSSVALKQPVGTIAITPTVSQADAEAVANRQVSGVARVEGSRLVVDALGTSARLAWESTVDGAGPGGASRLTVHVDAQTGGVLDTRENVAHGSGAAAWNGPSPVTIDTTASGGTFSMTDPGIRGLSCQNIATGAVFTGPDDTWGNGDPASLETGCVDAMFGAQTEARMLSQWLHRNGFDGNGGGWPIRVGLNDVNAFYDRTQVAIGHNTAGQSIGSIDVVAHEFGHGIDDHTPGGISGAGTQEFVADTFGASTEWFANEPAPFDTPDFTVGEKINLLGKGPIRNMANPSAVDNDPNCFSAAIPGTEVHAAAGPGNHWFYLLAEGTNPTNGLPASPTCNGSTVTGLGVQNAIRIMYGAMLLKTSASSYPMYRSWTLQSALSLFPGTCVQFQTVKAAWDAVSVPAQPTDPTCTAAPHTAMKPAMVSWGPNRLDVVAVGNDKAIYHKGWNGTVWQSSWDNLGGGFTQPPAIVSRGANLLDVFGVGLDGAIYHKAWNGTVWQSSWDNLGGGFLSAPSAVARDGSHLDVFAVGLDKRIYHKSWTTSGWGSSWEDLGGGFTQPPAVVARSSTVLDVLGVGLDNAMYHKAWSGNAWQASWESLGGGFTQAPAASSSGPNSLDVFGIGTDKAMYHKAWTGTAWQAGWENLGGGFLSAPAAVDWAPGRVDVFAIGLDNALFHKAWSGNAWQVSWEDLGGGFLSAPSVAAWGPNRLDTIAIGLDSAMYHKGWGGSWQAAWDNLGGGFQ